MGTVKVASADQNRAPTAAVSARAGTSGAAQDTGNGGGSDFDPYAGAVPRRVSVAQNDVSNFAALMACEKILSGRETTKVAQLTNGATRRETCP